MFGWEDLFQKPVVTQVRGGEFAEASLCGVSGANSQQSVREPTVGTRDQELRLGLLLQVSPPKANHGGRPARAEAFVGTVDSAGTVAEIWAF